MSHNDKPLPDDFDRELRGDAGDMHQNNYGFSKFFEMLIGVISVIGVTFLGWACFTLVSLREDVAVLKDRPTPVTQEAFNYRMESVERRLTALESRK